MTDHPIESTVATSHLRVELSLLAIAIVSFSGGISWYLVYQLRWRDTDVLGLLPPTASAVQNFALYAVLIGLAFAAATAPVLVLSRVYKRHAGPAGDTGRSPL
ncbi:hypothetical protein [Ramlibacter sp. AN1133]|uniref:hypothetical protein n=1 Tax=Ramlibacter sp. AN1133 TaxID=3133429 RepID=UPI0030BAE1E6